MYTYLIRRSVIFVTHYNNALQLHDQSYYTAILFLIFHLKKVFLYKLNNTHYSCAIPGLIDYLSNEEDSASKKQLPSPGVFHKESHWLYHCWSTVSSKHLDGGSQ